DIVPSPVCDSEAVASEVGEPPVIVFVWLSVKVNVVVKEGLLLKVPNDSDSVASEVMDSLSVDSSVTLSDSDMVTDSLISSVVENENVGVNVAAGVIVSESVASELSDDE
ncbi:MAG: hypothetical protein Q8J97_04890, partial [Flavobacteriaceae bacterium]|nr:hypothetical protein [Flavobacteriaceae bacterium]